MHQKGKKNMENLKETKNKTDNIKIEKMYVSPSINEMGKITYIITMCSGNTCNGKSRSSSLN